MSDQTYRLNDEAVAATPRSAAGASGVSIKVGDAYPVDSSGDQPEFSMMVHDYDYFMAWQHIFWMSGGWKLVNPTDIECLVDGLYLFQAQVQTYGNYSSQQQLDILVGPQGDFDYAPGDYDESDFYPGLLVGQTVTQYPEDGGNGTAQTFGLYPCKAGDRAHVRYSHTSEFGRYVQGQTWFAATQIGAFAPIVNEIPSF